MASLALHESTKYLLWKNHFNYWLPSRISFAAAAELNERSKTWFEQITVTNGISTAHELDEHYFFIAVSVFLID